MLPVTILRPLDGRNATNWPGFVLLHPQAPQRAAVWAQEAWEASWKLNPWNLIRSRLSQTARRDMEIMGHEIEVQAAVIFYGEPEDMRRRAEAASMMRGYDGLFRDFSQGALVVRMLERKPEARAWVDANRSAIARWL